MDTGFYNHIKEILESARNQVYSTANSAMVRAYWSIGKSIVEQQGTDDRAEYGKNLISELSAQLTRDFGKGFTPTNLRYMRQFYLTFPNCHALRDELSWTHYRMIMKVEDENARNFYVEECAKSNWSTRQLERQINSFYYQRLLSSRNKEDVSAEISRLEPGKKPEDVIHDPYVLEFLGLKQSDEFYESDLEQALIGELQNFLLELGRGFSFVARQKHINLGGEHFYIDLVFYNYILKCFVLIDLKTGKLTHQDIGQMDSYIRIFDEFQKGEDDNPTIGIVLCSEKNEAIAKYSVLNDGKQLFASKYQLTLPTAEELEHYLENERRRYEERSDIL
ncbi:MAG: PDDEXK nuclease domain-containing protein [Lachnospiraceae bacterium]|nr:PDDEXK nuclease domain-containing protein [Lachnospiraceae bacterium]